MSEANKLIFTFDIGNTNPHIGVFESDKLVTVLALDEFLKSSYLNEKKGTLIVSSVRKKNDFFSYPEEKTLDISTLRKNNDFLDMKIDYSESLGVDRLVTGHLAYKKLNEQKLQKAFVIDAGTFITCDVIDREKGFLGGHILPGIKSLLSLSTKGEKLPELDHKTFADFVKKENSLPHNTNDALYGAIKTMLSGFFKQTLKENGPADLIILTGSGANIVSELIDSQFIIDKDFIHKSMFEAHKHFFIRS